MHCESRQRPDHEYTPDWGARGTVSAEVSDASALRAALAAPRSLCPPHRLVFGTELIPFCVRKYSGIVQLLFTRCKFFAVRVLELSTGVARHQHGKRDVSIDDWRLCAVWRMIRKH